MDSLFLKNYHIGMPVYCHNVVGRIVAEDPEAHSILLNGQQVSSILFVSTPHGTVIRSGTYQLKIPTQGQLDLLKGYEADAGEEPYLKYHEVCKPYLFCNQSPQTQE